MNKIILELEFSEVIIIEQALREYVNSRYHMPTGWDGYFERVKQINNIMERIDNHPEIKPMRKQFKLEEPALSEQPF